MISFKQYLINESKLLEGKQEFLKKYQTKPDVKDLVSKFWIIRQRLKAPQNDIDYWIKQPYDEFKRFVVNFDTSKTKETRKQDSYTREAEKWGAVMFGKFGSYEAWFVPTHEAAIQLGRFYKGISTKWCISTNEYRYFDNVYSQSEFIFLISDDKNLRNYQKIALQLTKDKDLEAIWDVVGENIFDNIPEFLEQPINNALYEFNKLNRSRYDDAIKSLIAKQAEYLKKNANKIVLQQLNKHQVITFDTFSEKVRNNITLIHIDIPNTVTEIGWGAFSNCKSLKEITIPNSVTKIGGYAFYECISLKSMIIPNSVFEIGESAFSNCNSLQSITIPNSVTIIRNSAFSSCKSLESINIPDSVTEIKAGAFVWCNSLKSLTIPNSVTRIGHAVFYRCKSLKRVIFSSNSPLIDQIKKGKYRDWDLTKKQIFIKQQDK